MKHMDYNLQIIPPVFSGETVTIAAAASKEYAKYAAVWLQSIVEHASDAVNYDIVIFERDIDEKVKKIFKLWFSKKNISVRFFNPIHYFDGYRLHIADFYFKEECYFRLAAPYVFRKYKRIVFTDIDLIFTADTKELYNIDIGSAVIAATHDNIFCIFVKNHEKVHGQDMFEYSQSILGLSSPERYYNTGVLIIDIEPFCEGDFFDKAMKNVQENHYIYQEQCALNVVLEDKIYELPAKWNCPISIDFFKKYLSDEQFNKYLSQLDGDVTYHYLGSVKPWHNMELPYAELWWSYARKTPFYEKLIIDLMVSTLPQKGPFPFKLRDIFKYLRYRLLSHITFGKRRKHYKAKKRQYKQRLVDIL